MSLSKVANIKQIIYIRSCIIKIHYAIKHSRLSTLNSFRGASSLPLFDFGVGQSARHGVSLKNTHVIHLKSILLPNFTYSIADALVIQLRRLKVIPI